MKLSIALGIVLASAPRGTAFSPSAPLLFVHQYHHPSSIIAAAATTTTTTTRFDCATKSSTCLSMVGGGMIERPAGDNSNNDDDDDDDDIQASSSSTSKQRSGIPAEFIQMYEEEKEKFLAKLGRDIEFDPYDPNPYIRPRPGKYGWDKQTLEATSGKAASMQDALDIMSRPSDEELMERGNPMSTAEREENLNIIRRLRQYDIPTLYNFNKDKMLEASVDANTREKNDPWYNLNERLEDAIKYDTEDVDHLKKLIERIGGPPPQLVKYANHPRGYVLRTEIVGMPFDNEQIESMLDRRESLLDDIQREERRKEAVRREMAKLDNSQREAKHYAELVELVKRRKEEAALAVFEEELARANPNEKTKERMKEYEKEREELLKVWEAEGKSDVEAEYMRVKEELVDKTMKGFVSELKRNSNLYYDFEADEFDEDSDEDDDDDEGYGAPRSGGGGGGSSDEGKPMSKAAMARLEAMKNDGSGRPRLPGDVDVTRGEIDPTLVINDSSTATTGPLTVQVSSAYNTENSDPPMRKHCFQYTVRITNNSETDTVQLLSRRFEIQTVGSSMKDVVQGEGVTGRQPILKPGEVFEYTSTAPLSVRPIGTTEIAARMSGEYRYCTLEAGQEKATEEQVNKGQGEAGAELATFHFVFPEAQRVKPVRPSDDDDDDDDEDTVKTTTVATSSSPSSPPTAAKDAATTTPTSSPASSLPGEPDMTSGNIGTSTPNDSSDTVTSDVRVVVSSTYRPERSDAKLDKHCFAYNVRITNESKSNQSIQLVSRRFEIQTVGSANKDVVQGPGVTGRQPVLKPGESFEYTSTAPLSVRPMLDKTKVVARMSGEYNFVQLADDGKTPLSSTPLKAELGAFHFILPE
ncbi:hypothetical protein ACHAWU_008989 [Discostella pseudostelligera]|uniref:ApaG domain-containing protein n=1 Tax=Discostella pseudostelligera TaxID=259834 RepID=A0ABD3MKD1_9STRA